MARCPQCGGSGGTFERCWTCNGAGEVQGVTELSQGPQRKSGGGIGRAGCLFMVICVITLLICVYAVPKVFVPPQLASSYRGTIHQTHGNQKASFTLSSIREDQTLILTSNNGNITGETTFSPQLVPNGHLAGNVRGDKTMDFTIGSFHFYANVVNSVKFLSGYYDKEITNPKNNTVTDITVGTWQLTAIS